MLAEGAPALRAVNPTAWKKKSTYPELEFRPSLHSFASQRADLMAVLEPFHQEGGSRSAAMPGAEGVIERTVMF